MTYNMMILHYDNLEEMKTPKQFCIEISKYKLTNVKRIAPVV